MGGLSSSPGSVPSCIDDLPRLLKLSSHLFGLRTKLTLGLSLLWIGCGGVEIPIDTGPIAAELMPMADPRGTVSFLGTLNERHNGGQFDIDTIEYVVRAFEPDVVLVQLPPDSFDDALLESDDLDGDVIDPALINNTWLSELPELYGAVLPLRDELGYEVIPVSGWTDAARDDLAAFEAAHPNGPMERWYVVSYGALQAAIIGSRGARDPRWLHGDEYLELTTAVSRWLAYYSEEQMGAAGELTLHAAHARLIDPALDAHRGARILVVFAHTSRWYIEPLLRARDDFRFQPISAFLPSAE